MTEFKIIKEKIKELEYQETEGLLTDRGIAYLKELKQALQLQQTGVKQSVFYSIVDNGKLLEKFKEKETAEYALEEYKRMGFPYATISETVA